MRVEIHHDPGSESVAAGRLQAKIWGVDDDVDVVLKVKTHPTCPLDHQMCPWAWKVDGS